MNVYGASKSSDRECVSIHRLRARSVISEFPIEKKSRIKSNWIVIITESQSVCEQCGWSLLATSAQCFSLSFYFSRRPRDDPIAGNNKKYSTDLTNGTEKFDRFILALFCCCCCFFVFFLFLFRLCVQSACQNFSTLSPSETMCT